MKNSKDKKIAAAEKEMETLSEKIDITTQKFLDLLNTQNMDAVDGELTALNFLRLFISQRQTANNNLLQKCLEGQLQNLLMDLISNNKNILNLIYKNISNLAKVKRALLMI